MLAAAAALALLGVAAAQQPLARRVAACLERARPALLRHLASTDGGELALCCLAAVHDEVPATEPAFAAALDRLSRAVLDDTYGLALRLMVMAELPSFPRRDELARRDADLLMTRQTSGGFSYHSHDGWWDLSNTQYAVLGLRAASALGVEMPQHRWVMLYQAVQRMQHEDGGFTYRAGQGRPSADPSMAAAGIAVLQVAAQFAGFAADDWPLHEQRVQLGWQWLARHKQAIGDRSLHCSFYFHYGLERAAILSDVEVVGGVDWYAAGAAMFCDLQERGGGFCGSNEFRAAVAKSFRDQPVDTAFAVLFLRRKFQKAQGPVTGRIQLQAALLPADANASLVRAAVDRDAALGRRAVPALLCLLHSELAPRRAAAVLLLFRVAGQDFGLQPYRAPAACAEAIHRAELWWLQQRGGEPR